MFIGRTDVEAETPILWQLMGRTDLLEKMLMMGKIEGGRKRGQQRMRWLDRIADSMHMSLTKLQEFGERQGRLACCSPWSHKVLDMTAIELNRTSYSK